MRKSKTTKLLAVILLVVMLVSAMPITSSAATTNAEFKRSLAEVESLLNTVDYMTYTADHADVKSATKTTTIKATSYKKDATTAKVKTETYDGEQALYMPDADMTTWEFTVPETGMYSIQFRYYPVEGKATSIERSLSIDGKAPFSEARALTMTKVWIDEYVDEFGVFQQDLNGNDIRPTKAEAPEWREYIACDSTGYTVEPFQFYLEKGTHTLSLECVREPIAISEIRFAPVVTYPSYEEKLAEWQASGLTTPAIDPIKLNAENPTRTSERVIYPIYDRASAITDPQDAALIRLNTIGAEKWQTTGQWIRYEVEVPQEGLYNIAFRFRQEKLAGMYTSRRIIVNGELPFKEASYLQFNYDSAWQSCVLNDGKTDFLFHLKEGKNVIEFEVTLGSMASVLNRVSSSLENLNNAYLQILMITGATPDQYRDYNFGRLIPESIKTLAVEAQNIYAIFEELKEISGQNGSHIATLYTVANLVERMASDEDEVAKNLNEFKTYLGTLGTWLNDSRNQALEVDYITIQSPDTKLPKANANFFEAAWFEIQAFVLSFFSDYTSISSAVEGEGESKGSVTMWYTDGRDQAQIVRQMIDYEYTPQSGVSVNLKLVAGGSLLPSILAGVGPDVAFLGSADTINYAIRSAVLPLNDHEGFTEFTAENFSPAAMVPLTLYGTTYGLPSTMDFNMMFYRLDVFAELGIELPETWGDMYEILPILQNNKMEIGFPSQLAGTTMALYQMGGDLYADEGKRINLDSNVGLTAFSTVCDLFEKYKFPLSYNLATRFRTGEIPLAVAGYSTYNTLIIYASEIRELWEMVPLLGWEDEKGNINNCSTATVSAIVMPRGAVDTESAWDLMKWFTGPDAQARYANELVAVLGPAGKHHTANVKAFAELPWTAEEYKALEAQINNLAAVPEYPGGYIITRYVQFAFLDVYNNSADAVESMLDNITEINKEISRKRKEFDLDYYEISYSTNFVEAVE